MPRPPFTNRTWSCASCGTSTTPVRRAGHALCNACGLRRQKPSRRHSIAAPPGATATKPRRGRPRTKNRPDAVACTIDDVTVVAPRAQPKRPPPILIPDPSLADIVGDPMSPPSSAPLSAHADSSSAHDVHYRVPPPSEMSVVLSPLSTASSQGHAPPKMRLIPSTVSDAYGAPSFGDIVNAMLSIARPAVSRPAVSRPAVSRPAFSDTPAEDNGRFLPPPVEEDDDVEGVRENLEALQRILHDGGRSSEAVGFGGENDLRQWLV